jgi:RepB DNA-primase from phage plasmid
MSTAQTPEILASLRTRKNSGNGAVNATALTHPAIDYLARTFWEGDWLFFFAVHAWKKHADTNGNLVTDVKLSPLMQLAEAIRSQTIARLEKNQAAGWNIYVCTNPFPPGTTTRTESLIRVVRNVHIETDGGDTLSAIRTAVEGNLIPTPHSILQSSPDKYHVLWHVHDIPPSEAKALNRALASRLGGDHASVDIHRVLRMPGFRNLKYADKPVCMLVEPMNCDGPYTREQFKIETVVSKGNGATLPPSVLAAVIARVERNAREGSLILGPRKEDANGYKWDIVCPWHAGHTVGDDSSIIMLLKDGRLQFSCLHSHCAHRGWSDIRKWLEARAGHRLQFVGTGDKP